MKHKLTKRLVAVLLSAVMIVVMLPLAGLSEKVAAAGVTIKTQPKSVFAEAGSTAKFTVAATGTGTLKYQWQSRKDSSASWSNSGQSGAKTATLSVAVSAGLHGWQFRCIVTDANGATATSYTAKLMTKLGIVAQPTNVTAANGNTAKFTVSVLGKGTLTYQWQSRKDASSAWSNSGQTGAKTATLSVATSGGLNGWQFRCIIKDSTGASVTSNTVKLTVTPKITTQPTNVTTTSGSTAKFTVAATGKANLTYQWQARKNASSEWSNSGQSGAKTATLSVSVVAGLYGWQFRCIVTDGNGQKATSNVATLYVVPEIVSQPQDQYVAVGNTATFKVSATGKGTLTYQWQSRKNSSAAWSNSGQTGAKTETLKVTSAVGLQGWQFRCVVTDGNGKSWGTRAATLTMYNIPINEKNFPDSVFRGEISSKYDKNKDGKLGVSELAITTMDVNGLAIKNLKGVEYFTSLSTLHCYDCKIASLDLHTNKELQILFCWNNGMTTLDVTGNTKLRSLQCSYNKYTKLDVSKNKALDFFCCDSNQLTALDVTNNTALKYFNCSFNALTKLDVSKNKALEQLFCDNNKLTTLNVSACTKLHELYCFKNQLTSLTVNSALVLLDAEDNALKSLNVTACKDLKDLYCNGNQLTKLDVTNNTKLVELSCGSNQLTALNVSKNTKLTSLACRSNKFTKLDVTNCTLLEELYVDSNVEVIGMHAVG
ncbi:MAG: hypothetical protein IKS10_07095 [Lachnospiraceae bacterium]|nr:hypothetical protein [Lachnospiraceae bacterium]